MTDDNFARNSMEQKQDIHDNKMKSKEECDFTIKLRKRK